MVALCETVHDILGRVCADNVHEHRQRSCRHGQAAFTAHGSEGERILFPRRRFFRKRAVHFLAGHLFPAAMRNFTQPVARLHLELVGFGEDLRRLHCAPQG